MKALKFYATWCEPCKTLSKIIEGAKDKITVPIENIDIEQNMELAQKYGIRGVPALVIVNEDGTEIKRQSGMMMEDKLLEFLS
jgi:thioredoxin-like negative regulator of GroEL